MSSRLRLLSKSPINYHNKECKVGTMLCSMYMDVDLQPHLAAKPRTESEKRA